MDYVKREDQNFIEEESYKAYTETQHIMPEMDYQIQHTAISMEQLHQAVQNSLNSTNLHHNFQIPLSPRQMSTLMLKTNQLTRNFAEIPAHLPRNLSMDMDLAQNLVNDIGIAQLTHNIRNSHDDILGHNLSRLSENPLRNDLELPHNIALPHNLVQTLNEHIDLSRSHSEVNQNLSRHIDLHLTQNLRSDQHQGLGHELDLSQHINRNANLGQEMLDERRTPIVGCSEPMLDQNLSQNSRLEQTDHILPSFHIKSELEDEGYFYDTINPTFPNNLNGVQGHLHTNLEQQPPNTSVHQESQIYSAYNHNQVPNMSVGLAPVDLYSRTQNFVQNYTTNNVVRENPQNLVMHRQYENHSPYPQEMLKKYLHSNIENEARTESPKIDRRKENLKPRNEYDNQQADSDESKPPDSVNDDLSMSIKGEYFCYKCNEVFPTKRGLKQHSRNCADNGENNEAANKVGKFSCTQCPYRCQSPAILKIHERTHTGEKPFSCTFCEYKSGQKNNVAKHILVHMKEKPFRCQYCEYRCAQKNNLVVHERTHTGFKPFACPYCDYRTVQKPNLVKHMYLHTNQKPFSCDQCSYKCVQKTNLTKHKQRHLNEKDGEKMDVKNQNKPYRPRQKSVKCPYCPYKCVQKSSLDKHLQFKHVDVNLDLNQGCAVQSDDCDSGIQNLSVKKDVLYDRCEDESQVPAVHS